MNKEVNSYNIEYYNPLNKYDYLRCFKTGLSSSEVKRRGIKPFIVMGRHGTNEFKFYFNTWKDANIKFNELKGGFKQ